MGTIYITLFVRVTIKKRREARAVAVAGHDCAGRDQAMLPAIVVTGPSAPTAGSSSQLAANASHAQQRHLSRVRKRRHIAVAKMLVISFAWYAMCLMPSPIITTYFMRWYSGDMMRQLWVAKTLTLCGYAASPVSSFGSWQEVGQYDYKQIILKIIPGISLD